MGMKGNGEFSIGGKVWPGASKLIEEMGELQQVLGKLIGSHGEIDHYDGTDLEKRLVDEIADVLAAIAFFRRQNLSANGPAQSIESRFGKKLALFEKWHEQGK
jgi:NTP pyrophosphatase (non-canonical NTP hydrolase)